MGGYKSERVRVRACFLQLRLAVSHATVDVVSHVCVPPQFCHLQCRFVWWVGLRHCTACDAFPGALHVSCYGGIGGGLSG